MFCPKCHTHIIDDSIKFCSRCGENLEKKKRKSTFSTGSSFSSISSGSTFKYMSKYGKKSNGDKFNYENIKNEETLEKVLNNDPADCDINQSATANNHNDQFNYNLKYSGVTKKRQSHDDQFNYSKQYSGVTKKGKSHDDQYNYSRQYSGLSTTPRTYQTPNTYSQKRVYDNQPNDTSENTYRFAFIGPNKDSIIKNSFSVPGLLLGPLYLIYRKMTALGIILQIVLLIIQANMGEGAVAIQIFINIFVATKFRTLYLSHVDKNVKEIIEKSANETSTEILYKCSQKGGTLKFKEIIKYAVIFYILSLIATGISEADQDYTAEDYNTNIPTVEKQTYTISNYQFETEYDLKLYSSTSNSQIYKYSTDTQTPYYCLIKTEVNTSSNTYPRNFLISKQNNDYLYYNASNVSTESYNNKTWYTQYYYPPNSDDYVKINAMKDYNTYEIYAVTTMSFGSNVCEEVTKDILMNFEKNY